MGATTAQTSTGAYAERPSIASSAAPSPAAANSATTMSRYRRSDARSPTARASGRLRAATTAPATAVPRAATLVTISSVRSGWPAAGTLNQTVAKTPR